MEVYKDELQIAPVKEKYLKRINAHDIQKTW